MLPELEKPRITEIQVRMDCNGCVQKIKKALNGINGIYDVYIDFPQQKLTIIGWADLEKIIKAIKKTRKIATVCSHTEQTSEPPQQAPPEGSTPPSEPINQKDGAQRETGPVPIAEPPTEPPPPSAETQPDPTPSPSPAATANENHRHPAQTSEAREIGVFRVIHHHSPEYDYRYGDYGGQWNKFHNSRRGFQQELPSTPIYVTHSHNMYRSPPCVTQYEDLRSPPLNRPSPLISEYEYLHSPANHAYDSRTDRYRPTAKNTPMEMEDTATLHQCSVKKTQMHVKSCRKKLGVKTITAVD